MVGRDNLITASLSVHTNLETAQVMTRDNVKFNSMSIAYSVDYDELIDQQVNQQLVQYNQWVEKVFSNRDFYEYFYAHNADITRNEIEKDFSKEFANMLFSMREVLFETRFRIVGKHFFDCKTRVFGTVHIAEETLTFEVTTFSEFYPNETEKYYCLWNWRDDEKDFIPYLDLLLPEGFADYTTEYYAPMDCYEQSCYDDCPCFENYRVALKYLQKHGYLKFYSIRPDREIGKWNMCATSQGDFGLALLDKSFLSDKHLMKRIKLIMGTEGIKSEKPIYFLTNVDNHEYISYTPASFGGHRKLKIYGKLDCRSAKQYISRGQYVNHRVFFANEETAVSAGYRPCAVCMPEAYKKWKETK